MPVVDSRRVDILQAMLVVVQGMTSADAYAYPLVDPDQATTDPTRNVLTWPAANLPVWVLEVTPEGNKDYHPGNQVRETLVVNVVARGQAADVTGNGRMEAWEALAADLERAFAADTTLGGLVYDLRLKVPTVYAGVGGSDVVVVQPVEMRTHRRFGQP